MRSSLGGLSNRLAEYLVQTGKIKAADIEHARQIAREGGHSLGTILTRVGLVSDRDLADAYATLLDTTLLDDDEIARSALHEGNYKETFLRDAKILPLGKDGDTLRIAVADPENEFALDALSLATSSALKLAVATTAQVERGFDLRFGRGNDEEFEPVPTDAGDTSAEDAEAIDRLRDLASEAPIVRLVNVLIQRAVEARASDIHLEPQGDALRVRYRIDGVLHEIEGAPQRSAAAVVSRIKLMAKMNIAERRLPQDGRITIRLQGEPIDLRVSTVPTVEGESVVLRILAQDRIALELDTLGFDSRLRAILHNTLERPHGIILVTGPTGSGKTTTLYALLSRLNAKERKILTIEDPVEYQLEGINQIQVKPQIGLDFPKALRSIVRQDPDVIMIGEMRDVETARIAVQSALTGHLVLSTLHTNDAGSTVTRLLDMGIEDYLVTSSVNVIIAQRLVRRLCIVCRAAYEAPAALLEELELPASTETVTLYRATGCDACARTGYHGRTVIAEILVMSDRIRRAVLERADGKTLERLAVAEGMRSMKTYGLTKALEGVTTIEEVLRVTSTE